jgi:adenylate cyclase
MLPKAADQKDSHSGDGWERIEATVGFVDIAGFSAISDVFGDASAMEILEIFEGLVREAMQGYGAPVKWIGDEAMLAFSDPGSALAVMGRLLKACRAESRIPLTRSALNHGALIRRGQDLFGSTVNIAARLTGFAAPGQLLVTAAIANFAASERISTTSLGPVQVRSVSQPIDVYSVELASATDPSWVDPVCKMHAPFEAYHKKTDGPWFCSRRCAEAWRKSPGTYTMGR